MLEFKLLHVSKMTPWDETHNCNHHKVRSVMGFIVTYYKQCFLNKMRLCFMEYIVRHKIMTWRLIMNIIIY